MKRILTGLADIVSFGFIALALAVLLSMFSVGGIRLFTVLSGSMEPSIRTGSLIFEMPSDRYAIGDVVTRTTDAPDVTVTHRIIAESVVDGRKTYRTKGDANDVEDDADVPETAIVGRVRLALPWLGYAVNFAKTREGFALLVIAPAAIVIYEESRKVRREIVGAWKRRKGYGAMADVRIGARECESVPVPEENIGHVRFDERKSERTRRFV